MSFGKAASRGAPMRGMDDGAPCPCDSGASFGGCCGPVLRGGEAHTADRLMRSRYSAFVLGDAAHLARSWHPRTRPDEIAIDPDLTWTGLEIQASEAGGPDDTVGEVEFRASWILTSGGEEKAGVLHERSRFVRLRGRWCYLDGQVD